MTEGRLKSKWLLGMKTFTWGGGAVKLFYLINLSKLRIMDEQSNTNK